MSTTCCTTLWRSPHASCCWELHQCCSGMLPSFCSNFACWAFPRARLWRAVNYISVHQLQHRITTPLTECIHAIHELWNIKKESMQKVFFLCHSHAEFHSCRSWALYIVHACELDCIQSSGWKSAIDDTVKWIWLAKGMKMSVDSMHDKLLL